MLNYLDQHMDQDTILKLAREAGGYDGFTSPPTDWDAGDFVISPDQLVRFAELLAAATAAQPLLPEREGQPRVMTITGNEKGAGHWYSPAAVRELLDGTALGNPGKGEAPKAP